METLWRTETFRCFIVERSPWFWGYTRFILLRWVSTQLVAGFFGGIFLREVPRIATDSWQAPAVTLGYVFHSIKIGKLSKALRSRNYHESYTYLFLVLTICLPMLPFKQDDRHPLQLNTSDIWALLKTPLKDYCTMRLILMGQFLWSWGKLQWCHMINPDGWLFMMCHDSDVENSWATKSIEKQLSRCHIVWKEHNKCGFICFVSHLL